MAKSIVCELWIGTSTSFFKFGSDFESISACKEYIRECITCYHEIRPKIYRVGLKNEALFLIKLTNGNRIASGISDNDVCHRGFLYLNSKQLDNLKKIIKEFGFSPKNSLVADINGNCDFSCFPKK